MRVFISDEAQGAPDGRKRRVRRPAANSVGLTCLGQRCCLFASFQSGRRGPCRSPRIAKAEAPACGTVFWRRPAAVGPGTARGRGAGPQAAAVADFGPPRALWGPAPGGGGGPGPQGRCCCRFSAMAGGGSTPTPPQTAVECCLASRWVTTLAPLSSVRCTGQRSAISMSLARCASSKGPHRWMTLVNWSILAGPVG